MTMIWPAVLFWMACGSVFFSYVIYPCLLFFLSKPRRRAPVPEGELPSVTFLVSAYNEASAIREKIENLLNLEYPVDRVQYLLVSDGSEDATAAIIGEYAERAIQLIESKERSGKVNALNRIFSMATGDVLVFSDANSIFEKDAVLKLVRRFQDPRVGCVCGELRYRDTGEEATGDLEGAYWRFEQYLKRSEGSRGSLLGANGGIYAMRRDLFEPLPATAIIDDFLWPMKVLARGYQVIYEPEAVAYEDPSREIGDEMRRRIRIGAGNYQALFWTLRMLNPTRGFPAFAYFSHKVLRWLTPFAMLAVFVANSLLLALPFYRCLFFTQLLFYGLATAGFLLEKRGLRFRVFRLPYYFCAMNWGLLLGFFRFLTKRQKVTWQKVARG